MYIVFTPFLSTTFVEELTNNAAYKLIMLAACVAVATAQAIYLIHRKNNSEGQFFTVTREGLGEQSEKIKAIFSRMHLSDKEMNASLLLLEEIVMRLHEHTDQVVTAHVKNFYGKVSLHLVSNGAPYNPLAEVQEKPAAAASAEQNAEQVSTEDHFRDLIFKANAMRLSYRHHRNRNVVIIRAKK